ncbi:hypothetical protein AOLI_G00076140 [Acnodon oligacanthus]
MCESIPTCGCYRSVTSQTEHRRTTPRESCTVNMKDAGDWWRELQGDWSIWTQHPHQQNHQPFGFVQSADATQSCEGNGEKSAGALYLL